MYRVLVLSFSHSGKSASEQIYIQTLPEDAVSMARTEQDKLATLLHCAIHSVTNQMNPLTQRKHAISGYNGWILKK